MRGGVNTYLYVGASPLSSYDPVGLTPTGAAIGGRIGSWLGGIGGEAIDPIGGGIPGAVIGLLLGQAIGDAISNAIEGSKAERKLTWPDRPLCGCTCTCRADSNMNINTNKPGTAIATESGSDCRDARTNAARSATRMLGQQPKHVQCRCVDDKGNKNFM